jgi:hypothetical protein
MFNISSSMHDWRHPLARQEARPIMSGRQGKDIADMELCHNLLDKRNYISYQFISLTSASKMVYPPSSIPLFSDAWSRFIEAHTLTTFMID